MKDTIHIDILIHIGDNTHTHFHEIILHNLSTINTICNIVVHEELNLMTIL